MHLVAHKQLANSPRSSDDRCDFLEAVQAKAVKCKKNVGLRLGIKISNPRHNKNLCRTRTCRVATATHKFPEFTLVARSLLTRT